MLSKIYLTLRIALSYVIFGQLGFLLALLPDTNITLIWPPAGIALAAVLLRGNQALPGIFLGAVATSLLIEIPSGSPWIPFSVVPIIATASTLAALIAGKILRRYAPSAPLWGSAADLLVGSMGMGLASTLPAFVGVGCLYIFGLLPVDTISTTLSMWWLGEFCGMLIFTPLAFILAHRMFWENSRESKPNQILGPTVLNSTVAAIALVSFLALWTLEGAKISQSLEQEASIAANNLTAALHMAGRDLESIRALAYVHGRVDKDEFLRYTAAEFEDQSEHPKAQAVGWAPKVTNPKAWELEMLSMGETRVTLFERDDSGEKIAVTKRADYFPVQLIYPLDDVNSKAIGFDLGSEKLRRQALERARDTGQISMVAPVYLVQTEGRAPAMLICSAIYRQGARVETVADRRANLSGFSSGVYYIGAVFDQALSGVNSDVIFHLLDESLPTDEQWYHTKPSPLRTGPDAVTSDPPTMASLKEKFNGTAKVTFADHQWLVVASPGATYINSLRTWAPWGALILLLALGIVVSSIMIERILGRRRIEIERLKTETALQEARAANESKSYFMAAASHDIKQPLYALGILTDTLLMSNPPESTIPIVKSISKSIKEMSQHFDTLMDVGRFQDGSFKVIPSSASLSDLARRIDMEIAPLCSEKGLDWNLDVDDVLIHTDAELLLRLIRNLLINAVRYTSDGEVSFSAKTQGKVVCFEVSDTGEGLSPEQQELVFSEVRLRGNEIHTYGHGLGLSIVNKVSEALDLGLQVFSSEEEGTRFTFCCRIETLALDQVGDFTIDTQLR